MAVFEYQAINKRGRAVRGVIDAESIRAARLKLKRDGIFPTSMVETRESEPAARGWNVKLDLSRRRVSLTQMSVATRQLATLVGAGMPVVEALRALSDQVDQPSFRRVIAEISDAVNEGSTMASAMRNYPKVFPRIYSNMIASGEASGTLDVVLERLADLLERQAALRRKVVSALTYPVLMVCLCLGVVVLLLAYVVPEITAIFQEQNATLPLPTRVVIGLSALIRSYGWVGAILAAGAFLALQRYRNTPGGARRLSRLQLQLPLVGSLTLKIATSRFARNLGTMLQSGIEVLGALAIVKNIIGNVVLEEAVESAITGVREGRDLASELNKTQLFPRLLIHMVAIGERTGQLEHMLIRAANSYESEVDATVGALTSILEPVLIVFLAVIVGSILASVMLPMLEMSSLAGV